MSLKIENIRAHFEAYRGTLNESEDMAVLHLLQENEDWREIAEGLYFALNNDGVLFNNPLSKIMAESTSKKYERAKGMAATPNASDQATASK